MAYVMLDGLGESFTVQSPSSTNVENGSGTIQRGMFGEGVKTVQVRLNNTGITHPALVVDGLFGPLTEAAVQAFQQQHGLSVTGVVNADTMLALDDLSPSSGTGTALVGGGSASTGTVLAVGGVLLALGIGYAVVKGKGKKRHRSAYA